MEVEVSASDIRVEDRPAKSGGYRQKGTARLDSGLFPSGGGKALVFKLDVQLAAKVTSWDLDHIGLSKCDLKFFGVRVASVCGAVKAALRKNVVKFGSKFFAIHMPRLLRKVEDLIRARVSQSRRNETKRTGEKL